MGPWASTPADGLGGYYGSFCNSSPLGWAQSGHTGLAKAPLMETGRDGTGEGTLLFYDAKQEILGPG